MQKKSVPNVIPIKENYPFSTNDGTDESGISIALFTPNMHFDAEQQLLKCKQNYHFSTLLDFSSQYPAPLLHVTFK